MKRTTITMDEYGRVAVPSDAASVWMSEMELVELFNVIVPTLRATVRSVYKSGVLKSCEVETRIRLPNGYYAEAYALPMVVALAFHINTPNAARVRNALLERMCLRKDRQMLWLSLSDRQPCINVNGCDYSSIYPFVNTPVWLHIHTTIISVRRSEVLLLRAFSFRHFKVGIAHPAVFSYPSVSFASFCIVLRIKALAALS